MNRFLTPIPCSFESWLYRGSRKTISEHRAYQQLNLSSLGVNDPIGHRLGTSGVGANAARLLISPLLFQESLQCLHAFTGARGEVMGGIGLEPTTSSV